MKVALRVGLVVLTAMVIERGVASQLRVDGVAADLLLLLAISAGMVAGPDDGAVVGFVAGLGLDLLLQTPLGLGALVYCVTGYLVGVAQGSVVRASRLQPVFLAAAASALAVGLYVAVSLVLGRSGLVNRHLLVVIAVVSVVNALLIPVANRVMRWVFDHRADRRAAAR